MQNFVDTEIGKLPQDWSIQRLDSLFTVRQGKQVSKSSRAGSNQRPFLRTSNVLWGHLNLSEIDTMRFSEGEERRLSLCVGDLLVCEGGDVGRTAIWNDELDHCYYQNHLHRLRAKDGQEVDPLFMMYWFWYGFDIGKVYFGRGNVTTIPNLSQSRLSELLVPKPPLSEQQKIAAVLGLVQRAIEHHGRLIELTTELKKALMHKLFTEGLRGEPQKETEIGLVPESWEMMPLEKMGEVIYGIQASVAHKLKPIGTKILTNKNITLDGEIDLSKINYFELKTKRHFATLLKKGDLLFNWRSGSKEHVGKTAYFDLDGEFTHSSFILRIRPNEEATGRFLFYYLNYLRESGYFVKSQTFSINAKFNKSAVNALPIHMPDEEERAEIADMLDSVTKKNQTAEGKKILFEKLSQTLLHQLMTAQIRVHDLDLGELEVATKSG